MVLTWLHTDGKYIKDQQGNIVFLRGAARLGMIWGWTGIHDETDADYRLMKNSGANVVRIGLNRFYWGYQTWLNKLDQIIGWCETLGLRVVLSYDSKTQAAELWNDAIKINDIFNPTDTINWLKTVATRYLNNPTVCAINIMNEPPPYTAWASAGYNQVQADDAWRAFALVAAQALHSVNPNLLIFVGNNQWCTILTQFINTPLPEPNIVYAWNRYYGGDLGYQQYANDYRDGNFSVAKTEMEAFYRQVALDILMPGAPPERGHPVILFEFGYVPTDPNWQVQAKDCYAIMNRYGVGYVQWVFHGEEGATPVGTKWGMLTKDWSALNERGQVWKVSLPTPTPPIILILAPLTVGLILTGIGLT